MNYLFILIKTYEDRVFTVALRFLNETILEISYVNILW